MSEEKEPFLSRWSRLKEQAKLPEAQPAPQRAGEEKAPPPELPSIEKLTFDSDYRGFFHPKVDENLRRAALKRLFSDPHFNVMDGLDVYIEDYSRPDPLPAAMLAQLKQAQKILDWASGNKEKQKDGERALEQPPPAPRIGAPSKTEDGVALAGTAARTDTLQVDSSAEENASKPRPA
jgi:hypothetical protein